MVDNTNIQFMWPITERSYCRDRKYLTRSWSSRSDTYYRKYKVANPQTGESLIIKVGESNANCYISGSLRRWYFGKLAASRDLNKSALIKAIKNLSSITGIPEGTLLNGNLLKVELGLSVKLKREHELFIPSLLIYGRLKRKRIGKETVEFMGSKKSLICYDKSKEVGKKYLKKKLRDKITKNNLIMRIELKIKSKWGTPYGTKVQSLKDIIRNWDFLLAEVYYSIRNKVIKDVLFSSNLDLSSVKLTYTEILHFLAFIGIEKSGLENVITFINTSSSFRSKISENRKKILKIYNSHKSNDGQLILNEIYKRMDDRVAYLKA